jgi:hypothetical protein
MSCLSVGKGSLVDIIVLIFGWLFHHAPCRLFVRNNIWTSDEVEHTGFVNQKNSFLREMYDWMCASIVLSFVMPPFLKNKK